MKLAALSNPIFQASIQKLLKEQLPLKTAFKLKGIAKLAQEEIDKYEEVRRQAIEKYGDRDADGNLVTGDNGDVKISGENLKQFIADIGELLSLEVEVGTISVDELGDKLNITAEELLALDGIVV